jgi:protein-tyrosine phosphatase
LNSTVNPPPSTSTPSAITLVGAPNFRSLAGIQTADGRRIREHRLFRSELLSELTEDDLKQVGALEIGLVCDLRNPRERAAHNNRWPAQQTVRTVVREPDSGLRTAVRPDWETCLLAADFDEEQARQFMLEAYRNMPLELARHIVALVEYCGRPGNSGVLIHCMAGKDRTGFVCAMMLSMLGVPIGTILENYMESEQRLRNRSKMQALLTFSFGAEIPARAQRAADAIGTVRVEYLQSSFNEIDRQYGSIDAYLASITGLTNESIRQMQQHLLTPL